MNTINIAADATAQRIGIGNQYENEATAVVFDCSQFAEDHGAGTAQIIHRRPTESIGYVCTNVTQTNNSVTWLVTDDDTSFTGKGQVQLRWYVNDVLRESVIFPTYILPSVTSSGDAPEDVKSAVEKLMEYIQDNTISTEDLDERIANYFYDHPLPMEGEADGLVAGSAKQLLSESYTLDQVPYLYRKSPDSDRAVEEIVGGTVGWNQLVYELTVDNWLPENGVTASFDNGVATISSTAASNGIFMKDAFSAVKHKYLIMADIKGPSGLDARVSVSSAQIGITKVLSGNGWEHLSTMRDNTIETSNRLYIYGYGQTYSNLQVKNVIITDLTTLFGTTIADYIYSLETATAGAGVAKLKEWGFFNEDYYEYCEPTLRSVEGLVRKKTVGFNQFDKTSEIYTGYLTNSGSGYVWLYSADSKSVAIKCLPNTQYYVHTHDFVPQIFRVGDVSGELPTGTGWSVSSNKKYETFTTGGGMYTTSEKADWIIVQITGSVFDEAKEKLCVNISDPTRNGQYEPYESHSYPLDSEVVLRGVPKLDSNNNLYFDGDVYPSDGNGSRRYGLVDLGTLDWTLDSNNRFKASIPTMANKAGRTVQMICDRYTSLINGEPYDASADKVCYGAYNNIYIHDSAYADAASFKTAMSGIYLLYELATPTTFTALPYHNPQIVGDTEEWVTTGIVPVGHATKYYQNLRKKIEGLPWNFSSLIAPTEVTNKATRNYTTGSYLILNNVLYKVTSNIANGGTISPNSNVTATTIMAEIMSL